MAPEFHGLRVLKDNEIFIVARTFEGETNGMTFTMEELEWILSQAKQKMKGAK